jgi:hypothetical protein
MSRRAEAPLVDLQRWMLDVITHPEGVRAGAALTAEHADSAVAGKSPQALIERSNNLTGKERIEIYASMYYWRLIECMQGDFPAVQYVVGEEAFERLARAYVAAYPSRYYNLNRLGVHFEKFLRETPMDVPHRTFLAELASQERAFEEVFDAPPCKALDVRKLKRVRPDEFASARLTFVPAVRLLEFTYPVNTFVQDYRDEKEPAVPEAQAQWLVVYRRNYNVYRMEVSRCEYTVLLQLRKGLCVGDALAEGLADVSDLEGDPQTLVGEWFRVWTSRGFFAGVETGESESKTVPGA